MKRFLILVFVAGLYFQLNGQSFSPINPGITGSYIGSVQWGDYDNNGTLDFLISGGNPGAQYVRVIRNNGNGTFNSFNVSLETMRISDARWADFDNDGDLDIAYSGLVSVTYVNPNYLYNSAARILKNNGSNTFVDIQANLTPLYSPTIKWSDIDNDGDLDLLMTGNNVNQEADGAIYINNGNDKFEKISSFMTFVNGELGDMDVGDFNFDQQNDIALYGRDINGNNVNSFYLNKGNLEFVNLPSNIFSDMRQIGLSDLNGDGKFDFPFHGGRSAYSMGTGILTFGPYTDLLYNYNQGDFSSEDYNNDGKNDLFSTGYYYINPTYYYSSHLYLNQGSGIFSKSTEAITGVGYSSQSWGDYDGDKDLDLLLDGYDGSVFICRIFVNNMLNPNQSPSVPTSLNKRLDGHNVYLSWARSNDNSTPVKSLTYNVFVGTTRTSFNIVNPMANLTTGKLKIPQSGNAGMDTCFLIKNLSPGKYYWSVQAIDNALTPGSFAPVDSVIILPDFTEVKIETNGPIDFGSEGLIDYDKDNDLDILVAGDIRISYVDYPRLKIYENTGIGFTARDINLKKLTRAYLQISDINNDNWPDFMLSNYYNSDSILIRKNLRDKTFGQSVIIGDPAQCVAGFSDYNNDGKQDIIYENASYRNNYPQFIKRVASFDFLDNFLSADINNDLNQDIISGSNLFINNGSSFNVTSPISNHFTFGSSGATGDLDNDGDLDINLAGSDPSNYQNYLLKNNGNNSFTEVLHNMRKAVGGGLMMGDYDNDGYNDILINGYSGNEITKLYRNKGNMLFEEVIFPFLGLTSNPAQFGDIDNDNDLDIILCGSNNGTGGKSLTIYYNNNANKNTPPSKPTGLTSQPYGYGIKLNWQGATDDHTPVKSMTYNVRVGTSPLRTNIVSPLSDTLTGKRYIVAHGNAFLNTGFVLDSLTPGTYYWSVQAIDGAYVGGTWASEQSFIVSVLNTDFTYDTVCVGNPTLFTDKTLVSGVVLDSWIWDFGDGNTLNVQNPTHIYSSPGNYSVTLTARSGTNSQSKTHVIIVKARPTALFTSNIACQGTPTNFSNITVLNGVTIGPWYWDFGDGQSSSLQNPGTHGYINTGNYTVILTATASNGCVSSFSDQAIIAAYPVAAVTANAPLTFCQGDSVTISVQKNTDYTYKWLLNGTGITNADSSKYVAKITGNYSVEVVNKTGSCKTTSTIVNVKANNSPEAPFISASGPAQFCQGDSVVINVTQTTGYSYKWKLNGGAVGTNQNSFVAKTAGTYSITVTNSSGCAANSTNTVPVIINPIPNVVSVNISGATSFCQGGSVELSVTNNPVYTYQWMKNGSNISGATTSIYTAQNSGVYALTITNTTGCIYKTEDVTVTTSTAPSAPAISAAGPTQFCQGDSVVLSVTQTAGYSYQWKLNGGTVGTNSYRVTAKNAGSYNVVVSNSGGCSVSSSNPVDVLVNNLPVVSFVNLSGPTQFCDGGSVTLSIPSTSGLSYSWRNEYGLISGANSNSYTTNTSGNYQLDITNAPGCVIKTSPVNVVVKPMPDKPEISSLNYQSGKCLGETPLKIDVSQVVQVYTYAWYKNGIPVSNSASSSLEGFLSAGNYSVEANLDGCKLLSDIFNVFFADAPEKPLIYAQGPTVWYLACSNDSSTQYKWYYNGTEIAGADKYLYVANQNLGNYYVSISNEKGCFTASDVIKIPTGATGIEDVDPFAGLKIYPNPTSGLFTVEMDNQLFGELMISISDQGGKEILVTRSDKTSEHFSSQVDLSRQAKGIYFISLNINGQISNKKIIIE